MIGIINYGSGNVQAIANIYNRTNIPYKIIHKSDELNDVDKLILPTDNDVVANAGPFNNTSELVTCVPPIGTVLYNLFVVGSYTSSPSRCPLIEVFADTTFRI